MAINKKLIHFKNKENFNIEVAKGNILNNSIVFIQDTKEIYTHGTIYDGSTFDPSDIEASIQEINNRFNISLEYDLVEYPDVVDENNNPIFTSVEEGQTLEKAINTVETNVATLVQEVLNNEEVVSKSIVNMANAVGLDDSFQYIPNPDAKYISSATSLAEADLLLDQAIKNSDEVYFIEDFVDIYYGNGTCTQQQYDKLKQAILDGKLIVDRASYSTNMSIIPLEKAFLVYQRDGSLEHIELHHIDGNTMYCTKMFSDLTVTTDLLYRRIVVTQTSELENNSGFITEEDLPSIEFLTNGDGTKFLSNDGTYKEIVVPTKVSDLEDGLSIVTLNDSTPIVESLIGDELIPIRQDGENKAVSVEQIKKEVINNGVIEFASKYEFVDLGLPSGTRWATCNIGANSPEEAGLYFAWGETEGYSNVTNTKKFSWTDYKLCNGSDTTLTKYNTNSSYGTVDNLLTLEQVDDAAYQSDSTCRIPNVYELDELGGNTISTWETLNGVNGRRLTSKINGNSIFIPAAGYCYNGSVLNFDSIGYLWSSSLNDSYPKDSWSLNFNAQTGGIFDVFRCYGFPIRPVQSSKFAPVDLKNLQKTPYIWDGTTISETIYNELLEAALNFRDIILTTAGYLNYRLIGSTYISGNLRLTFCNTYSSPNFLFVDYLVTPNSVEFKRTPLYAKRESNSTHLNTAFYTNIELITDNTTFTFNKIYGISKYEGQFSFGDTVYTITFPNNTTWVTYPSEFKANTTYQFEIINNIGKLWEVGKGEIAYKSDININSTNSSDKLFLIGATDQSENSQTYSNSGVYTESGNIYASHFYETSDARHKTNIKTIIDSNNIPNLVEFDWKKDGTHSYGFIAQELEKQGYSELVNTDDEGNKTVNYSAALSLTVGKMQKRIDELEQKLQKLEGIIEKFNNIQQ